jgi:vancomycin resistance protein YoaR
MKRFLSALLALTLLAFIPSAPIAMAETFSATTPLFDASEEQLNNIELAVEALSGTYVESGEEFSFNDVVGPRTEDRGYVDAVNGRGSDAMGGGVSQVAATLYLALKQMDGIEYTEKRTYGSSFTGSYVNSGSDAIVTDYNEGVDFSFLNNGDGLNVNIWTTDSDIECEVTIGGDSGEDGFDDEDSFDDESGDSGEDGFEEEPADLAGSASFYVDDNSALINNIDLAASAINGTVLEEGETFSFNDIVGPRTEDNGYVNAVNGRGVKVIGGGVAQVASVLWLAIKDMSDITVVKKSTYGDRYNQSYVDDPDDAIVTDYAAGTDFRFRNDGYGPLTIYTVLDEGELSCEFHED